MLVQGAESRTESPILETETMGFLVRGEIFYSILRIFADLSLTATLILRWNLIRP